ncbi:MAG: Ig-like domain-containing protein, partial [Phototrophicaceae bacterium]
NDTWNYANGDSPLRVANYYIATTDRRTPGNNLTTTLGGTINFPTTNVNGVSSALGNFTYIPPGTNSANYCTMAAGTTANDTFTYTVSDSRNATATATVTLTIKTPDAAPNQKPSSSGLTITYGNYTNTPSTYTSAENWLTSAYNANQGGAITSSSFLTATQSSNSFAFNTAATLPNNRGTLTMNTTTGVVSFTPGSYYGTSAAVGTTNYDITIKVTDNGGRGTGCSEVSNRLRITVTGNYVAPTTAPAMPTSETGGQTNGGI